MRSLGRVREFRPHLFNTTRPRQNGHHFVDDTFSFIFLYENCRIFYSILTELSSQGSNQQYSSNSADKSLVSNRRQAVIWTNHGLVYCPIHASLGSDEYIYPLFFKLFIPWWNYVTVYSASQEACTWFAAWTALYIIFCLTRGPFHEQLCCRAMCKILYVIRYNPFILKTNLPSNFDYDGKIVREIGPWIGLHLNVLMRNMMYS